MEEKLSKQVAEELEELYQELCSGNIGDDQDLIGIIEQWYWKGYNQAVRDINNEA